jgi:2-C-methyl-D-erythritol 4-phosphate cytidylyltransferase
MDLQVVIPAAGLGERLGEPLPKALVKLHDKALVCHTLQKFTPYLQEHPAIVLYPPSFRQDFAEACRDYPVTLVEGGKERQESVQRALAAVHPEVEIVVLHDAARPFVSLASVASAIEEAQKNGAATVAIPVADTILQVSDEGFLMKTPDRKRLWACQTPQVFQKDLLLAAHLRAQQEDRHFTDDASLIRHHGVSVKIVPGTADNFKITTPEDLVYAAFKMEKEWT